MFSFLLPLAAPHSLSLPHSSLPPSRTHSHASFPHMSRPQTAMTTAGRGGRGRDLSSMFVVLCILSGCARLRPPPTAARRGLDQLDSRGSFSSSQRASGDSSGAEVRQHRETPLDEGCAMHSTVENCSPKKKGRRRMSRRQRRRGSRSPRRARTSAPPAAAVFSASSRARRMGV